MKLLLDVKDEKVTFVLELLENFKFVKVKKLNTSKEDEVLEGIKGAVEGMKLIKAGKLKFCPVERANQ
ncbi:MAG: hypothetical protein GDA37_02830 [Ekhidna sp.]|nr:hypothetical protein [Ekhidna sp.]